MFSLDPLGTRLIARKLTQALKIQSISYFGSFSKIVVIFSEPKHQRHLYSLATVEAFLGTIGVVAEIGMH